MVDRINPVAVFILTMFLLALWSELGFRMAPRPDPEKKTQVSELLASMLGLLALLLAFILTIVEDRFVERSELVVEEANAIEQTLLRSQLLPQVHAAAIRTQLSAYLDARLSVTDPSAVEPFKRRAEQIERALWNEAAASALEHPDSLPAALFVSSVNAVIDVGHKRLSAGIYRRLPGPLLFALFAVALLTAFVQGHEGGLARRRVAAAIVVGVSVALVLTVIVDLDRPWHGSIHVSQQPLLDVKRALAAEH
jgi:protein-S-isoprenylcysteine O-methyltransferase Ste14